MGRGSGGGSGGGGSVSKSKIGYWINGGSGRNRVGVIFNAAKNIDGLTVNPFGFRTKKGSGSAFYHKKSNEVYNSEYDIRNRRPSVHGDVWSATQAVLNK